MCEALDATSKAEAGKGAQLGRTARWLARALKEVGQRRCTTVAATSAHEPSARIACGSGSLGPLCPGRTNSSTTPGNAASTATLPRP